MSAFVLPEGVPVVDHDKQLPMFDGHDDPREALLFNVIRSLAEGNKLLAAVVAAAQARDGRGARDNDHDEQMAVQHRRHVPQEKEYREWASFRAAFQRLERVARREFQLTATDVVSMQQIHSVGGPSPKTQMRIMEKTHYLRVSQWPPTTWPVEPPTPPD